MLLLNSNSFLTSTKQRSVFMDTYHISGYESLTQQSQFLVNAAKIEPFEIADVCDGFNPNECISYGDPEARKRFARQWAAFAIIQFEMMAHGTVVFPLIEEGTAAIVMTPMLVNGIGTLLPALKGKRFCRGNSTDEKLYADAVYAVEQYTRLA